MYFAFVRQSNRIFQYRIDKSYSKKFIFLNLHESVTATLIWAGKKLGLKMKNFKAPTLVILEDNFTFRGFF